MDEHKRKLMLEKLGIDRPVVRLEELAGGSVRLTLLGGEVVEVEVAAETADKAVAEGVPPPKRRKPGRAV